MLAAMLDVRRPSPDLWKRKLLTAMSVPPGPPLASLGAVSWLEQAMTLVLRRGVEPPRPRGHCGLNAARLPLRHLSKRSAAGRIRTGSFSDLSRARFPISPPQRSARPGDRTQRIELVELAVSPATSSRGGRC